MKTFNEYFKNKSAEIEITEAEKVILKNEDELTNWIEKNKKDLEAGKIDFSNLDVSNIKVIESVFSDLNLPAKVWQSLEKLTFKNITHSAFAFENSNFDGDLSHWDFSKCNDYEAMFKGCINFTGKNILKYNFNHNSRNISEMFAGCKKLKLSDSDTAKLLDKIMGNNNGESEAVFYDTGCELAPKIVEREFSVTNGDKFNEGETWAWYNNFFFGEGGDYGYRQYRYDGRR